MEHLAEGKVLRAYDLSFTLEERKDPLEKWFKLIYQGLKNLISHKEGGEILVAPFESITPDLWKCVDS